MSMARPGSNVGRIAMALTVAAMTAFGPVAAQPARPAVKTNSDLGGTSWQLVQFQGSDGTSLIPGDKARYTVAFESNGQLAARIDCNRGHGTWTSPEPHRLEFGPLALTRSICPPGSLHDHIVKHWPYVRSYTMKQGRLFLALMADGGSYEFESIGPARPADHAR